MDEASELTTDDPIQLFKDWLVEAEAGETVNPTAAALATADASGCPSVRMVLLKGVDERGFVFYTNSESRKGLEMAENPHASLCFYWKSLLREVRVEGPVAKVSDADADAYFASRARASQIGAWASKQSRPMQGRFELEKKIAEYTAKFNIGKVPRPPFWGGYRIEPEHIEFWRERRFRLHDRVMYNRVSGGWAAKRLYP
ncbi:MAG: pyridoxamine 5'-phosphate oxidase [Rhodospirillales bacterium]|nr:pyridoxamine 5'-phosphate oxidase [Rhodospirillales bacterium]MDP6645481.1 pyridoxamine 5'-phosphate oxidase [Rhodospirillales bacterium]MDP6843193.1 pyridoxamine 5'-phosphate oxidase [Rhodospirillales bacterium]